MAWSRVRLRRRAVLALSVLLAGGTLLSSAGWVAARPAADEQARQWLERVNAAVGRPGQVLRAQVTIRERGEPGEITSNATFLLDHEQRKARFEVRRDNNLI